MMSREIFKGSDTLKSIKIKKLQYYNREINDFIVKKLRDAGIKYDSIIPDMVKEYYGTDLNLINNELDKIFLLLDDKKLDIETFNKLSDNLRSINIFNLSNAIISKNFNEAMTVLDKLLLSGQPPRGLTTTLLKNYNLTRSV